MCGKAKSDATPAYILRIIKNIEMTEKMNLNEEKYSEDESMLEEFDNITPGKSMFVAYIEKKTNELIIEKMRWGLNGYGGVNGFVFNTKLESLINKKTLSRFHKNRAIIVINGFYENKKIDGKKGDEDFFITNKNNQMILPVLYDRREKSGRKLFTIITRDASEKIEDIHERQPVILKKKQIASWLMPNSDFDIDLSQI